MSSNEKLIYQRYSNKKEEYRATHSRADGLEFHYTAKVLDKYIDNNSKVIELGCGTGYYGMIFSQKCAEYTGIDITPENIEVFNEKIKNTGIKNIVTMTGDATNLASIDSNVYDVVLSLGPMYHLPPDERDLAFAEAKRICKNNGIIVFAYQNKLGA
jgi:ubiquinone/menaquinone biosynthesis C-methylase UbiE